MINEVDVKDLLLDPKTDWFYLGEIDEDLISSFVSLVESRPHFLVLPRNSRRRLVNAVVECLQNIQHNTPPVAEPKAGSVVFMQRFSLTEYGVSCGNLMRTDEVEELKKKLDNINSADPEILRNMYMQQMERTLSDGNRSSAGLGLLEIARAVNGPISYRFVPMGNGLTFFAVELFLSLN